MGFEISPDDPRADDVSALLSVHVSRARSLTPVGYSFALDADELSDPAVTFFSARDAGRLVGVAALKELDATHAELKSMHTAEADRGRGVGRALVDHLLAFARLRGYRTVSLETGTSDDFLAARTLYARCGFRPCGPFGDYRDSPHNTFMSFDLDLGAPPPAG